MKRSFTVLVVIALSLFLVAGQAICAGSPEAAPLSGKVVETMNSGGYTYVCLEKSGKKTWLAVPQMKVVKGETMSFEPGMEMTNFESKTLKRTFDKIIFSAGPAK